MTELMIERLMVQLCFGNDNKPEERLSAMLINSYVD
jgi:hypothetical protein